MTMGCNIFQSKETMPEDGTSDNNNAPVRARQVGRNAAGALATYKLGVEDNNVVNVMRPRRGHDY